MSKENLTIKVTVPKKRIVDLFITACEGGSNYWCASLTPKGKGDAYEAMLAGFTVKDGESGKTYTVTKADIEEALQLFAQGGSQETYGPEGWSATHYGDWISENDDATTGDVFLQLCVFKKVIYG